VTVLNQIITALSEYQNEHIDLNFKVISDLESIKTLCKNIDVSILPFKIPIDDLVFLNSYVGYQSKWINQPLWNDRFRDKAHEMFVNELNRILTDLPLLETHKTVFRMEDHSYLNIDKIKNNIGKKVKLPHFLSTSKEKWDDSKYYWEISLLDKNSKAKDLSFLKPENKESEVLFSRYSAFQITDVIDDCVFLNEIEFDPILSNYQKFFL
jgi:hypothetical protein